MPDTEITSIIHHFKITSRVRSQYIDDRQLSMVHDTGYKHVLQQRGEF